MAAGLLFSATIFLHFFLAHATNQVANREYVAKYLERYGYFNSKNSSNINSRMLKAGIKLYQRTYGLPATGRLDDSTLDLMMKPRCGVTDLGMRRSRTRTRSPSGDGTSQSGFELFIGKPKWTKQELMYRYQINEELPRGIDYEGAIFRAFQRWESVCQYFDFRQLADYDPPERPGDIRIGWFSGDHGDSWPFDGPGGAAGHALPPPSGMLHFDADERWSADDGDREGLAPRDVVDLETVAVHEIGHVLGLNHTNVRDAVMFPSIDRGEIRRNLHDDDIQGIRALYPSCNFVARKG